MRHFYRNSSTLYFKSKWVQFRMHPEMVIQIIFADIFLRKICNYKDLKLYIISEVNSNKYLAKYIWYNIWYNIIIFYYIIKNKELFEKIILYFFHIQYMKKIIIFSCKYQKLIVQCILFQKYVTPKFTNMPIFT